MKNEYQSINQAVIECIVHCYDEGRFNELTEHGVTLEQAEKLAQLDLRNLRALAAFRGSLITFQVDTRKLACLLPYIDAQTERNAKLIQLMDLGATGAMLMAIAGLDRQEVQQLKKRSGYGAGRTGRPRLLTFEEEVSVSAMIEQLRYEYVDPLDFYLELGRRTKLSLGSVWANFKDVCKTAETANFKG